MSAIVVSWFVAWNLRQLQCACITWVLLFLYHWRQNSSRGREWIVPNVRSRRWLSAGCCEEDTPSLTTLHDEPRCVCFCRFDDVTAGR